LAQTTNAPTWYSNDWRGASYEQATELLAEHTNVVLVRIVENHATDEDRLSNEGKRLRNPWSVLHFQGMVVKSYKGDWRITERASFVHFLDSHRNAETNSSVGELMFVFTDEHTNTEFDVATGDFEPYQPSADRLFSFMFQRLAEQKTPQPTSPGDVATRAAPDK
jgi:hypothetical protein